MSEAMKIELGVKGNDNIVLGPLCKADRWPCKGTPPHTHSVWYVAWRDGTAFHEASHGRYMIERGDTVLHRPSGEEWLILRADENYVEPAGWPRSRAFATDCTIISKATPEITMWLDQIERKL